MTGARETHAAATAVPAAWVLRAQRISKRFGAVQALAGVDFEVRAGEVHALVGENGAGKSTLVKILQGVHQADEGGLEIGGRRVQLRSVADAQRAGIATIFQEFSLIPELTVAQNVLLNREQRRLGLIDDRAAEARAREVLAELGVDIDVRRPLRSLGTAQWQLTEIAKAVAQDARVLIMDEPTASLATGETEALFRLIRRLKERGMAIVYISHRMHEIFAICDRVTVLRDGRRVISAPIGDLSLEETIAHIVGREAGDALAWRERERPAGEPLLRVQGLSGRRLRDVSFDLGRGEVLGVAGLMGSGRTELLETLFGVRRPAAGTFELDGTPLRLRGTHEAIAAGIALVPGDRRRQGLVLAHSVRDNLLLTLLSEVSRLGVIRERHASGVAREMVERLRVRTDSVARPVGLLSGGNQQKVVLGKWLKRAPRVLLMDEPTAGIDIGAKGEIVTLIRGLADAGAGVIVASSELPELLAVSDRVLILSAGRVAAELDRREVADDEHLNRVIQTAAGERDR